MIFGKEVNQLSVYVLYTSLGKIKSFFEPKRKLRGILFTPYTGEVLTIDKRPITGSCQIRVHRHDDQSLSCGDYGEYYYYHATVVQKMSKPINVLIAEPPNSWSIPGVPIARVSSPRDPEDFFPFLYYRGKVGFLPAVVGVWDVDRNKVLELHSEDVLVEGEPLTARNPLLFTTAEFEGNSFAVISHCVGYKGSAYTLSLWNHLPENGEWPVWELTTDFLIPGAKKLGYAPGVKC